MLGTQRQASTCNGSMSISLLNRERCSPPARCAGGLPCLPGSAAAAPRGGQPSRREWPALPKPPPTVSPCFTQLHFPGQAHDRVAVVYLNVPFPRVSTANDFQLAKIRRAVFIPACLFSPRPLPCPFNACAYGRSRPA
ncbi:hypothetical protein ABPG77_006133 [Micractinium sp. CCAP 211/92]